jgi:hypothetical protein
MSLSRCKLIMAIYPNARGFAYIVFDGPLSPVDWGISDLHGAEKKETCIRRVDKLLKVLNPDVLVLRDPVGLDRRGGQLCMLIPLIEEVAKGRGIATTRVSRREIQRTFAFLESPTRSAIVQTIAKHIPVFDRYVPPQRKIWQSEDRRMGLFDAAALAQAYYHGEDAQ